MNISAAAMMGPGLAATDPLGKLFSRMMLLMMMCDGTCEKCRKEMFSEFSLRHFEWRNSNIEG